jgi:hypothetical protein
MTPESRHSESVRSRRVAAVARTFREASIHCEADWTTLAEDALQAADAELRDALDDVIRQAYSAPIIDIRDAEDPEAVRVGTIARLIADPDRMRHLVRIQNAAWELLDGAR